MPAHDDGTVAERFSAMMFLRSEVERLQAQVEADDALLLSMEWCGTDIGYGVWMCYCCEHHPPDCECDGCNLDGRRVKGHDADCELGRRCDEARARQESKR